MKKRQVQLADEIRDILAQLLVTKVSDPRVEGVVITHVKLTADLQLASIYYRVYQETADKESLQAGMTSCTGLFKRTLSKELEIRKLPEIRYFYDQSIEEGAKIEKIISDLKS